MNVIENNNSFTGFEQVFPEYIFTDAIPKEPPSFESADSTGFGENEDGTKYRYSIYNSSDENETYAYLVHLENFQLTKEFRQEKLWKLEFNKDEESLRQIIFPGLNTSRNYTPEFYRFGQSSPVPFTSVDPFFDLENCRIKVALDFDKLFIDCWLYVGKNLKELLASTLKLPFNSKLWLIKDLDKGSIARFELTADQKIYVLPPNDLEKLPDEDMLVSTRTFNWVINHLGELDEGEYW